MSLVISSKGSDVTTWRAAEEFGFLFRQALLDKAAALTSGQFEALSGDVRQELERRATEHDAALALLRRLMNDFPAVAEPDRMGEAIREFYGACYALFGPSHSAPAFYRLSAEFLRIVARSVLGCALGRLKQSADRLPPLALIALGPTGRHEFSPFCSLQLLLVCGETGADWAAELPGMLGQTLHELFGAAGLPPDGIITPRNPGWCGTMGQWRQRLPTELQQGEPSELVDLLRLVDQTTLFSTNGLAEEFRNLCLEEIRTSRSAVGFLVPRILALSNGIGLMGGLRLERNGPHRGRFALFDHALLPFSSSVMALSLMTGGVSGGTPQRIRELLSGRKISVDLAERLLVAWHTLSELRLIREGTLFPHQGGRSSLHIDPESLTDAGMERFLEALETVDALQRHVAITFSVWEEQAAC